MLIRSCELSTSKCFRDYRQPFSTYSCHMARATPSCLRAVATSHLSTCSFIFLQSSVHGIRFRTIRTEKKLSHSNNSMASGLNCYKIIFKDKLARNLCECVILSMVLNFLPVQVRPITGIVSLCKFLSCLTVFPWYIILEILELRVFENWKPSTPFIILVFQTKVTADTFSVSKLNHQFYILLNCFVLSHSLLLLSNHNFAIFGQIHDIFIVFELQRNV